MYYRMNDTAKPIKVGPYTTSKIEIRDLIKSWIVISIAFTILRRETIEGGLFSMGFFVVLLFSAITVGTAFIFHEIAHKIAAQRYGCFAEFRSSNNMLFLALIMSFFGFIFFAPGAVMIGGPVGKRRNGIISASGPGTNLGLAIVFLILNVYISNPTASTIFSFGYLINTWIGLFNLIPAWLFDGKKIYNWNKAVYFTMVAVALGLLFFGGTISSILG
jgi:Zn-dependent protease